MGFHGSNSVDQDSEVKIVHEPKSFVQAYNDLVSSFKGHSDHETDDEEAKFLHGVRREGAVDMLTEARGAYEDEDFNRAWYFLVRAAESIGYLVASQHAVYPREGEAGLRSSLRASGRKGGKTKGENAKKIEKRIVKKLRSVEPPKRGWSKTTLRSAYNKITSAMRNYKDADRKWRALSKLEDIQRLLPQRKDGKTSGKKAALGE